MLYQYFGGSGSQGTGGWDDSWKSLNSVVTYSDPFLIVIEGDFPYPHGTEYTRVDYYNDGDIITGLKSVSATTNSYLKGDFQHSFTEFWRSAEQVAYGEISLYDFVSKLHSGQDSIDGSSQGGSLTAWTHGGDDLIRLHTGASNYVDAGSGNDYLQNWSWYADGQYRGGAGNDVFSVGNGTLYGGAGADTFQVVPLYQGGDTTYANILDFEVGVDRIIGSGLELFYFVDENGIWLRADGADWSMRVANVFDPNQLGIS